MKIYRAYKFRMYPSENDISKINSYIGTYRFIYNHFLNKKEESFKSGISYELKDMKADIKLLNIDYPWIEEVDSILLRNAVEDLNVAYTNYFSKRSNHPRFKKKRTNGSYKTNAIRSSYKDNDYSNIKVDLKNHLIKLPKLNPIKIKGYRHLSTFDDKRIINATVSKSGSKYYVSVCVEEDIPYNEFILKSAVGIDVGIKNLVVTSDGIKYEAMSNIKNIERKIKGLNRWLSRSMKGSKNREKIKNKISRQNEKLKNIRKYYTHLITSKLVEDNDLISVENLNVKNMIKESKTKSLTKSILNSTFSYILRELEYKTKWKNKKLVKIDKYYPSSRVCSRCGNINNEVKDLSIRMWKCEKCGIINDRDINASINILWEGITKYYKEQYV